MASIRLSRAGAQAALRIFTQITQTRAATSISPAAASTSSALQDALVAEAPRINWTRDEIRQIYETPLHQLTYAAVRTQSFSVCGGRGDGPTTRSPSLAPSTGDSMTLRLSSYVL
ncbi:biotin synthase [Histoplasma capsulatum H143]|uniref:Biotin synthase n=1 Tax=Ajellomyces capsulatus (strain H143) TaxID=544712 RepID=C6HD23_AJECH|nr:biotin synthase [Histoplasma capsulatum H143]